MWFLSLAPPTSAPSGFRFWSLIYFDIWPGFFLYSNFLISDCWTDSYIFWWMVCLLATSWTLFVVILNITFNWTLHLYFLYFLMLVRIFELIPSIILRLVSKILKTKIFKIDLRSSLPTSLSYWIECVHISLSFALSDIIFLRILSFWRHARVFVQSKNSSPVFVLRTQDEIHVFVKNLEVSSLLLSFPLLTYFKVFLL